MRICSRSGFSEEAPAGAGNYRLFFMRFGLDWLTDDQDRLGP